MEKIKYVKRDASMLEQGVIINVKTVDQAKIAEDAGAVAIAIIPQYQHDDNSVHHMADITTIKDICNAVSLPVIVSIRPGHIAEAKIAMALHADYINECGLLSPIVGGEPIDKNNYELPFISEVKSFDEALIKIEEGSSVIAICGRGGHGDITETARLFFEFKNKIEMMIRMNDEELMAFAQEKKISFALAQVIKAKKKLPVVLFAAGGISTPADAAYLMMVGADGVIVGSGIFESSNPRQYASAFVEAISNYNDADKLAEISEGLGNPMKGAR